MNPAEHPTIDPARWARIVELFHTLVDRPAAERDRILRESCAAEPEVRREVEALLAGDAAAAANDFEHVGAKAAAAWADSMRALQQPRVNQSLGRYRIDALLGAGGMGTVYKAWDPTLHRDVALKVLSPTVATSAELRSRLQLEARAASSLNHPNIVTVYEIGHEAGVDFIAAELVAGETIRTRLAIGPMSLREVIDIGAQIAAALSAAHAAGIVHRDIKPENVAVRPDGVVKVLDFGLAILIPHPSAGYTHGGGGTASYMSPEQALGERIDHRSDLFSLGITLYEMIVGRLPFVGKSEGALVAAIANDTAVPPSNIRSDIAPAVDLLLARALEKDPELRYQSASDMAADLKRLRRVSSASSQSIVPAPVIRDRGRWRWAIGAGLLAAGVVLGAAWKVTRPQVRNDAPVRFNIPAPPGTTFTLASTMVPSLTLAASPDGRSIAFLANRPGQPSQIWVRALNELDAHAVNGTEGASFPFWSPDSRSLGFIADGGLRTINAAGGTPRTLVERRDVRGATWGSDGVILYGLAEGPIHRVPAGGGTPAPVTSLDASKGDVWHRWPQWLPGGRRFLYLVRSGAEKPRLALANLDRPERTLLFEP